MAAHTQLTCSEWLESECAGGSPSSCSSSTSSSLGKRTAGHLTCQWWSGASASLSSAPRRAEREREREEEEETGERRHCQGVLKAKGRADLAVAATPLRTSLSYPLHSPETLSITVLLPFLFLSPVLAPPPPCLTSPASPRRRRLSPHALPYPPPLLALPPSPPLPVEQGDLGTGWRSVGFGCGDGVSPATASPSRSSMSCPSPAAPSSTLRLFLLATRCSSYPVLCWAPRSCDDGSLGQEATHGPMVGAFGKDTLTQEPDIGL
ncbi:hypothetical protein DAI22_09g121450 [Oryza sativa Japonica Group]|nr:hypothetical protein DAI22_09g121450 [Oryza sativa Japonica Group]KAF2916459.1 hypothetical protein DAI22_09g121450 [Oryza sativa Japonica Group]KAF2916460.1 hypothetical protein DAI22_09g121450 [Oryza sativa Japonica Group]